MKKLFVALVLAVFSLATVGAGSTAEAAQKRTVSKKTSVKKSSKKKVLAARHSTQSRKVVKSRKVVAKKRPGKSRASAGSSARSKRSAARAPRVARLPKARSAPGALTIPRLPESSGDERTVSARAYAMDGATFYQAGKRIRVKGIDANGSEVSSEHAKQRLQRLLDSGRLQVEPVAADTAGNTVSVVTVNGRDVAEMVRTN
ncbi:MAG: hypothetical protein KF710_02205 [Rhodocyclaceae bacterium]|nr:hypothetical protein [Rhodocyclaceae bacterium]